MSQNKSLRVHALLLAASVAVVLSVTVLRLPQTAKAVGGTGGAGRLAEMSLRDDGAPGDLIKDESRIPRRD